MNPDPNLCRQKKDDGKNSIDLLIIVASGPAMFIYPVFISILSSFFFLKSFKLSILRPDHSRLLEFEKQNKDIALVI